MKAYLILSVLAIAFFLTFVDNAECFEENLRNVLELQRQRRQVGDDDLCPGESIRIGEECMEVSGITRRQFGKVLKNMGGAIIEVIIDKLGEAIKNRTRS